MRTLIIAFATIAALSGPAVAQSQTGQGGGLSSLLSGGLPKVGSASAGNAAGLLGYCVKNKVLGGANANSVLGKLGHKPELTSSPEYAAGQSGVLQTGQGKLFSLDGVKGQLKTRMCDMVLKRATSFL